MGDLGCHTLWIAFTTDIPQAVLILILVLGFTPYIVSLQIIEPWLMKRFENRHKP
jgi:hypothetical protein